MLPRLQSQERLDAINDDAVGGGRLPRGDMRRMIERLERTARGGVRPKAAKATPGALAAMGIGVVNAAPPASEEAVSDG